MSADDFSGTEGGRGLRIHELEDVWWVCEGYEIRGDRIVSKYPAVSFGDARRYPVDSYTEEKGWRSYRPLVEAPDLFLRFARLCQEPNFKKAALAWSHRYGLPGGGPVDSKIKGVKSGIRPDSMRLEGFWWEAKKAHAILTMYEGTLNRDAQAIKQLLADYLNEKADYLLPLKINEDSPFRGYENEVAFALNWAVNLVEDEVERLSYRSLVFERPDPSEVKYVQGFWNLLGAMYLQMYWLIASGGDVTRCEYCGRILSLAKPHPEGRKRRRDKRFCDDACRQAHHRSKKRVSDVRF
jgi:hypothetical protein